MHFTRVSSNIYIIIEIRYYFGIVINIILNVFRELSIGTDDVAEAENRTNGDIGFANFSDG